MTILVAQEININNVFVFFIPWGIVSKFRIPIPIPKFVFDQKKNYFVFFLRRKVSNMGFEIRIGFEHALFEYVENYGRMTG